MRSHTSPIFVPPVFFLMASLLTGCPAEEPEIVLESEYHYLATVRLHQLDSFESAQQLRAYTERDRMRALADSMIAEREAEIELLEDWLQEWYPEQPLLVPYRSLTRSLENLDPEEVERVFLEDMTAHHENGIMMSRNVLRPEIDSRPEVDEFAHEFIETRQHEIEQMRHWLQE